MKKYTTLFSSYLKQAMAYRTDAIVSAALSFFSVLVYYLLWSMLIPDGGTLNGFTLPEMVAYTMCSAAITPFAMSNEAMFEFAGEVRTGKFAKYLYTPISAFGVFVCSSLAKALPRSLFTALCCVLWSLILRGVMAPIYPLAVLQALPVLLMMVIFVILLNYLISCLSFRFTDILGPTFVYEVLLKLFAGSLAPLEVLFGGAPVWSPFYYLVGYPSLLMMGRATVSPGFATAVLGGYTLLLLTLCLTVARGSRRSFEGVGA